MKEKHTLDICFLPMDVLNVFILFLHGSGLLSSLTTNSLDIAGR